MECPKFIFEVNSHELILECDPFGKEIVYLDDKIIESQRRFRISGDFSVNIDNECYLIKAKINNFVTGKMTCSLFKSGQLVEIRHTKVALGEKNKYLSIFLLFFNCGMLGLIIPSMGAWVWSAPLLLVLCVAGAMAVRVRVYAINENET